MTDDRSNSPNSTAECGSRNESFFSQVAEALKATREAVNDMHRPVTEPLLRDGLLGAAWRQGVDELWQALKAFPDTIESRTPGTLGNPLQSEIAQARDGRADGIHGPPEQDDRGNGVVRAEPSPSPEPIVNERPSGGVHGPAEQGRDTEAGRAEPSPAPVSGGFAERILNERLGGGEDQNEPARGRVLPDEQLEHDRGRDR
jgi:hypothetical protein